MIHLMIDPNSASEFCCAKSSNEKRQNDDLFSPEQISARKPSHTYMPDGRKLVNGRLESSISPEKLWQECLMRGQIIHHVLETAGADHVNGTVESTPPRILGKDPIETTADDSPSEKVCGKRIHQTFSKDFGHSLSRDENTDKDGDQ